MSPEFVGAAPPERFADPYRAWHRTAAQIRAGGAIGSLSQGIDRRTDWYENGGFATPPFELLAVPDSLLLGD